MRRVRFYVLLASLHENGMERQLTTDISSKTAAIAVLERPPDCGAIKFLSSLSLALFMVGFYPVTRYLTKTQSPPLAWIWFPLMQP